jgi:hypothetical protein
LKKLIFLFLLIASPAFAQDSGYFVRENCGTLSPVEDQTVCLQSTTVDGRIAGNLYVYTNNTWTVVASSSGSGHIIADEGISLAQREILNFVGAGVTTTDTGGVSTVTIPVPTTAQALATNGNNCSAGSFPLGVDALGASENCTALPTTITGTSGEITVSVPTGDLVISLPSAVNLSGHTLRIPNSDTLPGSCAVGEVFLDTNATTGERFYACESGTFVLQGGTGGGGSGDVTAVGDCTTGDCLSSSGSGTSLTFRNATSGTITVTPVAGALGTRTLSLPASTGTLAITTDNVASATSLAANGANCSAGSAPLGVSAAGAAETCTDYMEEPSGTGIVAKTSANSATGRTLTGTSGNIDISNGTGVAGNPTFDLGTTAVQTDQANTWSTGAQDMSAATTFTVPVTAGAAPTVSGRLHYDSTANQLEYGLNGANKIVVNTGDLVAYLPLAGATMTGLLTTDNLGIEFEESDTNPTCAANNYNIYADTSDAKLMACVNGTATAIGYTITGTANTVTVSNGTGVSGNPTITLPTPIIDGSSHYAADAGSSDDYAITLTPAPGSYITGAVYRFKANTANTTAATLNVNAIGAKTIKKVAGGVTTDLASNDIRVGQLVDVVYDGTNMQMQSTLGNAASGISGSLATTNCLALEATSSSVECSSIVDDLAGNVSVGTVGADYHQFTFSAPTGGIVHTWPAVTGSVAQTTGAVTTGNAGRWDSSGRLVDGPSLRKVVQIEVFAPGTNTATGDGKAYFRVPSSMNGMNLVAVNANVFAAGTTGTINIDIARCAATTAGAICTGTGTSIADMLSTNITIDSGENDTATAAAAAVIDTGSDDVATGQVLRIDIDAVHTTPATGLLVNMEFALP